MQYEECGMPRHPVKFEFNTSKASQAMAYLVSRLEGQRTDAIKLMKLLYLANRNHFIKEGRPITGDDQYAMPYGPVSSLSLDLLGGQYSQGSDGGIFDYLKTNNSQIELNQTPAVDALSATELRVLDEIIDCYGQMGTWQLRDYTHDLPEYCLMNRPGTSTRIPYELLAEIYPREHVDARGRIRAVITEDMAARMPCPFPPYEES